jgi:hypothetical protein
MAIDAAPADGFTIGGTIVAQYQGKLNSVGGELRLGYVIPLTDHLALWPRIGVAHAQAGDTGKWPLLSRTDAVLEARLVMAVTPSWALTLGPTFALALQTTVGRFPQEARFSLPDEPSTYRSPSSSTSAPRIGVAIGITGRVKDGADAQTRARRRTDRFFLSVERAIPLVRYTVATGGATTVDNATADVVPVTPQTPRLAFDMRVGEHLTVGTAGSIGYVRASSSVSSLAPSSTAPTVVAWALAPRVGMHAPITSTFAFWPRLGLTYVNAATTRNNLADLTVFHLGADIDAFALFSPVEGIGFVFGPSLELPVSGARYVPNDSNSAGAPPTKRSEESITTVGITAGLVVSLP